MSVVNIQQVLSVLINLLIWQINRELLLYIYSGKGIYIYHPVSTQAWVCPKKGAAARIATGLDKRSVTLESRKSSC